MSISQEGNLWGNGVFQILHPGLQQQEPLPSDRECLNTPVFLSILVHSALADSEHHNLKNTVFLGYSLEIGTRKRCDFKTAKRNDLGSRPKKLKRCFAPSTCLCCFKGKRHCDLEVATSNHAAICELIPQFFCDFLCGIQLPIFNLRFENSDLRFFCGFAIFFCGIQLL